MKGPSVHEDDDEIDEEHLQPRRSSDTLWYIVLSAWPTLYIDEHSTVDQLLHQQILEVRALRFWLAALTIIAALALVLAIIIIVILT